MILLVAVTKYTRNTLQGLLYKFGKDIKNVVKSIQRLI